MEEEDWDFSRLFPTFPDAFATFYDFLRLFTTQPATASSPKSQKQPKTNPSKMHLRLFFFYHNKNISSDTSIFKPCKPAN
jgi:hypothetical protein